MARSIVLGATSLLLVLACSGESERDHDSGGGSTSAGTSGGGSTSAGTSGGGSTSAGTSSGGSGGSTATLCPDAPPAAGSACDFPDATGFATAHCSWGDDIRPHCRTTALCSQGEWQLTAPDPACDEGPLPEGCPSTLPASGATCSDPTLQCWYEDGTRCLCSPCAGGSEYPLCQTIDPPEWACATPDARCPVPAPQAGESCDEPELQCGPDCEQPITCRDGSWQWSGNSCPICAAADTPVETPDGPRPIAELRAGDLVYSVEDQSIVVVPILRAGSAPVMNHRVVRLVLEDGSLIEMSPGHPTADGRPFVELLAGGQLDATHAIATAELVPYRGERTYDILPASSSATYFVHGALVGSTLADQGLGVASARQRKSASQ